MSTAGTYSRIGNEFQDAVATFHAAKILESEEIISMYVEATGIKNSSTEVLVDDIILCYSSGKRKFIQVKYCSTDDRGWTIHKLYTSKELEKIIKQLKACDSDVVELICPDGFGDLFALKKDTNQFSDLVAFKANAGEAPLKRLADFCKKAYIDEETAYNYINNRITFGHKYLLEEWYKEARRCLPSESASTALQKLIAQHSSKHSSAPRNITKKFIEDLVRSFAFDAETPAKQTEQPIQWEHTLHDHGFAKRIVPVKITFPATYDEWDSVKHPSLQLAIRPKNKLIVNEIDVLFKKVIENSITIPLFWSLDDGKLGRNEQGIIRYILPSIKKDNESMTQKILNMMGLKKYTPQERSLAACTQVYRNHEVWFLDSQTLELSKPAKIPVDIERRFTETLDSARRLMQQLGVDHPYEVRAVIRGIGNRTLELLDKAGKPTGHNSYESEKITIDRLMTAHENADSSMDVLRPFFNELWSSILTQRPDHYDALA